MIKKKICLVGGYAVGKTSLVRKYVSGIFSEDYLTTVGVKIDQRKESVEGNDVLLMIWDLAGRDEFAAVKKSYLRGANGFLYVADGTRKETLDDVAAEYAAVMPDHPEVPVILLINKCDLISDWEVTDNELKAFRNLGMAIHFTSAKSGENVESAFQTLSEMMVSARPNSKPGPENSL